MKTNNKMAITLSSMKSKILSVILFLFLGMYSVQGQGDILKAIENAAKQMEEHNPGRDSARGRTPHNNNDPSGQQNDALKKLNPGLLKSIAAFDEKLDHYFPTAEAKCIFMMVNYLYEYFVLVDEIEATSDCEKKSDLLVMKAAAIAASTTIMYCPEPLSKMTPTELQDIFANYLQPILLTNVDKDIKAWEMKLERIIIEGGIYHNKHDLLYDYQLNPLFGAKTILYLCAYFSPNYILPTLIKTQREIEELRACGGTN